MKELNNTTNFGYNFCDSFSLWMVCKFLLQQSKTIFNYTFFDKNIWKITKNQHTKTIYMTEKHIFTHFLAFPVCLFSYKICFKILEIALNQAVVRKMENFWGHPVKIWVIDKVQDQYGFVNFFGI